LNRGVCERQFLLTVNSRGGISLSERTTLISLSSLSELSYS
jgi:hypothetical protein